MAYLTDTDADDRLQGTDKSDTVLAIGGDDRILTYGPAKGSRPDAEYRAQAADKSDLVFASDGDDRVYAGAGDDTLWGGDGDDLVAGGADADVLGGGSGDDIFVFGWLGGASQKADTGSGRNKRDVIADFEPGSDLIDLSGYENASAPGSVWIGARAPTATNLLQIGYHDEGNATIVDIYAPTGAGRAKVAKPVGEIELMGTHQVTASDFLL
jgi:RTX calcium-binding nonapeptide repeat (4 copies)